MLITNFIIWMAEEKKLTHNSIKTITTSVFHFFEMNDVLVNRHKVSKFIPLDENNTEDRAYTHEEIQKVLAVSDERLKVVVLLMASTGMRVGALPDIQVGDLTRNDEYNLYKIVVYGRSKRDRYYTFCTPECTTYIDVYLAYRKDRGELIDQHHR